ncbi:hypothetical protein ABEX55_12185 [Priestia endophytica]|uniref:hypothetical protein n=1 Tax=Priestia endophytica TaxID=135735 RepID=UPI003D2DADDF
MEERTLIIFRNALNELQKADKLIAAEQRLENMKKDILFSRMSFINLLVGDTHT